MKEKPAPAGYIVLSPLKTTRPSLSYLAGLVLARIGLFLDALRYSYIGGTI